MLDYTTLGQRCWKFITELQLTACYCSLPFDWNELNRTGLDWLIIWLRSISRLECISCVLVRAAVKYQTQKLNLSLK